MLKAVGIGLDGWGLGSFPSRSCVRFMAQDVSVNRNRLQVPEYSSQQRMQSGAFRRRAFDGTGCGAVKIRLEMGRPLIVAGVLQLQAH